MFKSSKSSCTGMQRVRHGPVLVMELCTAGSLYDVIEAPENAFGLCEEEFKTVMIDISKCH